MIYKFKNGATVTGTPEQILSIAKSIGETVNLAVLGLTTRGFYNSSTKGTVAISSMDSGHIRNALLKRSRVFYEDLAKDRTLSNADFLKKYVSLAEDHTVEDLYTELSKRK